MAHEDKIEQDINDALARLYQLNRIRPTQARLIAMHAMQNLSKIIGCDLEFKAADQGADTSAPQEPA